MLSVSQSFMSFNIRDCDLWVFFLCSLVRNVVRKLVCTADSRVQVCAIRVYEPRCTVFLKVSIIVFYDISTMLGINFTTKTELFTRL